MAFFSLLASPEENYNEARRCFQEKNYARCVPLFEKAYRANPDVGEFVALAYCYYFGEGVEKNLERCLELTRHDANKGVAAALNNLGFFYLNGIAVEKNVEEAVVWLTKSADKGFVDAAFTLAKVLHNQYRQQPRRYVLWRKYMKMAAERKHKNAVALLQEWNAALPKDAQRGMTVNQIYNCGCDWMSGTQGFPCDYEEAILWFAAAAQHNHAQAYNNLGWCLKKVGKLAEANQAYMNAANLGNPVAMRNLAYNLHQGIGWPKDDKGAKMYLRMAQERGDEKALQRLYEYFPEERTRDNLRLKIGRVSEHGAPGMLDIANDCIALGDYDEAERWLDRAGEVDDELQSVDVALAWVRLQKAFQAALSDDAEAFWTHVVTFLTVLENVDEDHYGDTPRTDCKRLAELYEEIYLNYEKYSLQQIVDMQERNWYLRQTYKYYTLYADLDKTDGASLRKAVHYAIQCDGAGLAVRLNYAKLREWLEQAIQLGDVEALYVLGFMYNMEGVPFCNIDKQMELYARYLRKSNPQGAYREEAGVGLAQLYIGKFNQDDLEKAEEIARDLRQTPHHSADVDALYGFCLMMKRFNGGTPFREEGDRIYQEALRKGSKVAVRLKLLL